MFNTAVFQSLLILLIVLGSVALGYLALPYLFAGRHRVVSRLRGLAHATNPRTAEPPAAERPRSLWMFLQKLGALFLYADAGRADDLRLRLLHAGYSHPQAPAYFMGLRLLAVLVLGTAAGIVAWFLFKTTPFRASYWALSGAAIGYLLPSFLLRSRIARRQNRLQKGLPDALDVLVLCLEGGLGFHASMQWVTDELGPAHPELGDELGIAFREMQMGLPPGDALKQFADRTGLESARDLAALLVQCDKLGVGLAKTLRTYAETARRQRRMKAQESAQKAAVKILFPTLLFIFPAIFIVLLGPAAFQLTRLFTR